MTTITEYKPNRSNPASTFLLVPVDLATAILWSFLGLTFSVMIEISGLFADYGPLETFAW
jgi:hypothetical protein